MCDSESVTTDKGEGGKKIGKCCRRCLRMAPNYSDNYNHVYPNFEFSTQPNAFRSVKRGQTASQARERWIIASVVITPHRCRCELFARKATATLRQHEDENTCLSNDALARPRTAAVMTTQRADLLRDLNLIPNITARARRMTALQFALRK